MIDVWQNGKMTFRYGQLPKYDGIPFRYSIIVLSDLCLNEPFVL
ncbi:hypothetical protein [Bacillus spizizenii]|nr:hypothetical protein [Bacillus spizizenii]